LRNILILGAPLLYAFVPVAGAQASVGDVVVSQSVASPNVRFTLIVPDGYVGFDVPGDWHFQAMHSQVPVAVAAFQVPDTADEGTPDSTNVAVSVIQPNSEQGRHAVERIGASYEGKVTKDSRNGWECFFQQAHQKSTLYTILDAKKSAAGFVVSVRLAWPHPSSNSPDYEGAMLRIFNSLLDSVEVSHGAYPQKPGDIIRRPEN
jgi:hypothetical protein